LAEQPDSGVPAGGERRGRSATRALPSGALERALDRAEPDGALLWSLLDLVPGLLERHARRRAARAVLVAETQSLLAGSKSAPPRAGPQPPLELLSDSELRVLRYLPTNLSALQIASELYVWHNTVRIHMRHLYAKLGTHPASPRRRARPRPAPAGTLRPALTHPGLAVARLRGVRRDRLHRPVPARQRAGILRPPAAVPLASSPHGPGGGGLTSAYIPPAPATGAPDHPLR
jgi:DNA-binding CsgD family transcriptional regulator